MWILILILLLLGAQLNLSGIVPLQIGDSPAPWWVGGRLLWPSLSKPARFYKGMH